MKLRVEQSEFTKLLSFVQKAIVVTGEIQNKCILLSAAENTLYARAASNEKIIKGAIVAGVDQAGECCVEGKLLVEIISHLEAGSLTLEQSDRQLNITIGSTQVVLNTIKIDTFTDIPAKEISASATIKASDLQKIIKKVVNTASKDNTRPILTGLYCQISEKQLALTASDSYRLAYAQTTLTEQISTNFEFVIRAEIFSDISSIITPENHIDIKIVNNQIILQIDNFILAINQIEGKFPDFRAMLPASFTTQLKFNKEEFMSALKQIIYVGKNNNAVKLIVDPESSSLELIIKTQDIGEANSKIQAQIKGEAKQLSYNFNFLREGIDAADSAEVILEILADNKPGLIKNDSDDNFLYLLMPIRN